MSYNKEPKRHIKITAAVVTVAMVFQLFFPTIIYASTGSTGQAENSSFSQPGTSNMVNLFTGDLNYSIPLLDIEGYPLELTYNGDVSMNTDASWVGLGWSCSPGFINREMRGLPDDFENDIITQNVNVKAELEEKFGNGSYNRQDYSIPFVGATWNNSKEEVFAGIFSLYDGNGFEKSVSETHGKGDNFGNNGTTESTKYNSFNGYNFSKTTYNKDSDFGFLPGMMNSETTSNTNIYNSRAGLTHTVIGAGKSSSFSMGGLGTIVEVVLTVISLGGFGTGTSSAIGPTLSGGPITYTTVAGQIANVANLVTLIQPSMSTSSNGSSIISTGTPTYTPSLSLETFRGAIKHENRIGQGFLFWTNGWINNTKITAFNNINAVKETPSNGFLNSSSFLYDSQVNTKNLYDINRENDGMYYETMPNLPVTNATNDNYHVRANGMVADYRAFRNDVGSYHTPNIESRGNEHGFTNLYESNIASITESTTFSLSKTKTGASVWASSINNAPQNLKFTGGLTNPEYESYYFKNIGEKVSYNSSFYDVYGGDKPAQVKYLRSPYFEGSILNMFYFNYNNLFAIGSEATLEVKNQDGTYTDINIPDSRNLATLKDKREYRNDLFIEKKGGDADETFFEATIKDYVEYDETTNPEGVITLDTTILRTARPSHHTSEIVVQNDQGGRYVYGIPTYNNNKKRVSFNVSGGVIDVEEELVEYATNDNTTSNTKGYNNYFNSLETPQFATGFLLTSIVNNDYLDVGNDGLTADDRGNYTKFNYSRIHDQYKWRTPYGKKPNEANFSTLHQAYDDDENGSYVYGNKEIWNVHSIESKNYIAEFYLSDRNDAVSVIDENGDLDDTSGDKLKKLDKIKLYAKEDRLKNGENAIPIKTVHFKYDYTLCPGIPSNNTTDGGKLTLRDVYFTYGNSAKGKESIYHFNYADFDHDGTQDVNYQFSANSVDRWGGYKPNSLDLINSEYPFVEQNDRELADKHAAAWRLSQIITPEGSTTDIYYEADDYAFVQNKRAMQMFKIAGVGNSNTSFSAGNTLFTYPTTNNNFVYFELQDDIPTGTTTEGKELLAKDYFKDINHLYFKSLVELKEGSGIEEYVEGYAKILDYGVLGSAPYHYGYIKLDPSFYNGYNNAYYNGSQTNPIAKAGWQALRTKIPRTYRDITSQFFDMYTLPLIIGGSANSDRLYKIRSLANNIDLDKSWVRLVNPNKAKIGGGARVQKIIVKDSWGNMGGDDDEEYGSTFDYRIENEGDSISSGVAAYEPFAGKEENPWRTPVFFIKENRQFPNDYLYQETPFGESHFPAPVVGYSNVKVKTLERTGLTAHATGFSVTKYYTAKDFPTIVDKTKKTAEKFAFTPNKSQLIIGLPTINHAFVSQGFVIIKNDMHGKKKGSEIYNEGESLISKSTIHYKSDLIDGDSYQLNNTAKIINKDGSIDDATIGKDIDVYNSYRESYDEDAFSSKTNGRTYSPFTLFGLLGKIKSKSVSKNSKRLYTTVFTKVINQYGLIDRIETEDLGTKNTLTNLAYDGETGGLLLTSVKNDYSDPIYKFNYPAHWYYDNLGQGYRNMGIALSGLVSPSSPNNGIITVSSTEVEYFSEGDHLLVDDGTTTYESWVLNVDKTNTKITCIDIDGDLIPAGTLSITIIKSGRNNMQNLPIGSVTTLTNPIANPINTTKLTFSDVIQSSAIELSDDWKTICNSLYVDWNGYYENYVRLMVPGNTVNPFIEGLKGKWRMQRSYSYNQERNLTTTATASEIRTDGTYTAFKPFWDFGTISNKLVPIYDTDYPSGDQTYEKWKLNSEMTRYGKDGNLVETKDILDRHATTLYGFSPTLKNVPIAIASNAEQKEIAFDSFEDYDYFDDAGFQSFPGHFNFSIGADLLVDSTEAHTGTKSLKIAASDSHIKGKGINIDCENETEIPVDDMYKVQPCDCERQFSPTDGKYIVSAWVKQDVGIPGTVITDAKIIVGVIDQFWGNTDVPFIPKGPVIDGWQRIEGVFNIPLLSKGVSFTLMNEGTTSAYFDDVRIHPLNAAMKTMVYDPANLRLMAELDNQNYATFFEYDEEGTLVRIKKETENGIVTIKETRSSIAKTP